MTPAVIQEASCRHAWTGEKKSDKTRRRAGRKAREKVRETQRKLGFLILFLRWLLKEAWKKGLKKEKHSYFKVPSHSNSDYKNDSKVLNLFFPSDVLIKCPRFTDLFTNPKTNLPTGPCLLSAPCLITTLGITGFRNKDTGGESCSCFCKEKWLTLRMVD